MSHRSMTDGMRLSVSAAAGFVLACVAGACGPTHVMYDSPEAAIVEIDTARVRAYVATLADDSMRGRATPGPELWDAARYISAELEAGGLRPFIADSFVLSYPLEERRLDTARVAVGMPGGPEWGFRDDVLPRGGATGLDGITAPAVLITGDPSKGGADLATADVEGKVVILVFPEHTGIGNAFWSVASSIPTPAAFLLYSEATDSMWESRARAVTAPAYHTPDDTSRSLPIFEIRRPAAATLISRGGQDLDAALNHADGPISVTPIEGVEVQLRLPYITTARPQAPIVAAVWGDEAVDREVVLSAHMDHLGMTSDGDVYNGADDNASGVSALLAIARAFGALDAPASAHVVFLFTSGEEQGGWGVDAFMHRLGSPADAKRAVVADLNLDMVGRNAPDTIHVIEPENGSLRTLAERTATDHNDIALTVAGDAWPAADFLHRSDQAAFVDDSIPAAFFFSGPHADYHQTTDDPATLDYGKVARVARLVFRVATSLAGIDAPRH